MVNFAGPGEIAPTEYPANSVKGKIMKRIAMACVLGAGLSVAGCGNGNNDKLVDASTKMMDAATKQMEAGTELAKKEIEAADAKAAAVKADASKAMDDAKKMMEKK